MYEQECRNVQHQFGDVSVKMSGEDKIQFSSVAQSCLNLCDPMDCSMPGLPIHHQLPEFTQTHVHWVSDAIQPSHPLPSPSPPAFNLSQHQGLFKWVSSLHKVAKVLELQLQHLSFQWIFRLVSFQIDWFDLLEVPRVFSSTTVRKHHFFRVQLYGPTLTSTRDYWKNHSFDYMYLCQQWYLCFLICCLAPRQYLVLG